MSVPQLRLLPLVALAAFLAGCPTQPADDDDDTTPPPVRPAPDRPIELDGACAQQDLVGHFHVIAQPELSVVDGVVSDGVWPAQVREPVASAEGCTLLLKRFPFCDPMCESGTTCDDDGSCIDQPESQDMGIVRIWGLAKDVVMQPVMPGYRYFDTGLPHPGFEPGADVHLDADGGPYADLKLEGRGVPPLVRPDAPINVASGAPVEVTWTADQPVDGAQIDLELTIDQHGTSPLLLSCTFEDDGQAQVPAALVEELLSAGVSGYPNGSMSRVTVDSAETPDGCVELRVMSAMELRVTVDDHTPCTSDAQCADGQSCDIPNQTCID